RATPAAPRRRARRTATGYDRATLPPRSWSTTQGWRSWLLLRRAMASVLFDHGRDGALAPRAEHRGIGLHRPGGLAGRSAAGGREGGEERDPEGREEEGAA